MNLGKSKEIIITLVFSLAGGGAFSMLGLPVPWLLGPMAASLAGSFWGKPRLRWPVQIRDAGLVIVGYSIGLSFTKEAMEQIIAHFPSIVGMTLLLIGYCALMAAAVSRFSGLDYRTVLIGSIPGGLSQMIALSEEVEGTDSSAVTVFQVFRLLMIIFIVPFVVLRPEYGLSAGQVISGVETSYAVLFPEVLIFAPLAVVFAAFARKIGMPTAYLTGPIIIIAVLTAAGHQGPALPDIILDISQLLIGAYIGLMFKRGSLSSQGKLMAWAAGSGVLLLAGATSLSFLLQSIHGVSFVTGYLSMAPGGMDQMSIIAHETGADLSIVAGYQLFRVFFIFFAVPYLLRGLFVLAGKRGRLGQG